MSDIPEEIRKMFPDQPIHKMDIDDNGVLQILSSSEPLSHEPGFEHMPIEQVNQYLRDHGYDPEQVGLRGKILVDALIENINLLARALAAEQKLKALQERTRWIPIGEKLPEDKQKIFAMPLRGNDIHFFNYATVLELIFVRHYTHWQPLPEPPEADRVGNE